jgi:hypothetical protein
VRSRDRGAATAELVMALPMLAVVTLALVWLVSLGAAQVRLVDAARETARALARGEQEGLAISRGRDVGPPGTTISVRREGNVVHVEARASIAPPLATFMLPAADQHAEASAQVEPCQGC